MLLPEKDGLTTYIYINSSSFDLFWGCRCLWFSITTAASPLLDFLHRFPGKNTNSLLYKCLKNLHSIWGGSILSLRTCSDLGYSSLFHLTSLVILNFEVPFYVSCAKGELNPISIFIFARSRMAWFDDGICGDGRYSWRTNSIRRIPVRDFVNIVMNLFFVLVFFIFIKKTF